MIYNEKDLSWIGLSICNSFSTLPFTNSLVEKIGVEDTFKLLKNYDNDLNIFPINVKENSFGKNFTDRYINKSLNYIKEILTIKNIESILEKAEKLNIRILTCENDLWPSQINFLDSYRPLALWCRGNNFELLKEPKMISIVGSRKCSTYGKNVAIDFAYELAEKNFVIVSGGAFGIDSFSHIGAINSTCRTISVLAGGVDQLYPSSNISIFNSILENGLIISESPIGTRPAKWKFLERNRLISALSQMTLVIEAPEKSGSLNTANYTVEYGKTLGVVPGNINSIYSKGTNMLLKQGAYPITSVKDILELLIPDYLEEELFIDYDNDTAVAQKRVLSSLYKNKIKTVEDLFLECELDIKQLIKTLSFLETKGKCVQKGNGWILNY